MNRRHSFGGSSSDAAARVGSPSGSIGSSNIHKRGFLGKLKDKAIGTKEEREAEKRNYQEVSFIAWLFRELHLTRNRCRNGEGNSRLKLELLMARPSTAMGSRCMVVSQ